MQFSWFIKLLMMVSLATPVFAVDGEDSGADAPTVSAAPSDSPGSASADLSSTAAPAPSSGGGSSAPSGLGRAGEETRSAKAIANLEKAEAKPAYHWASEARKAVSSCKSAAGRARVSCLANFSEHIQTGAALVQVLISGMGAMSTSDACSKHNSTMKKVQTALTLYNAACTGFQVACTSSCGTAKTAVQTNTQYAQSALSAPEPSTAAQAQQDLKVLKEMGVAVNDQIAVCEGYKWNLAAAASGLIGAMNQAGISKSCVNATTAGGPTGTNPNEVVDCSNSKYSSKPECICMQKPNSPGCPGYNGGTNLAGPMGSGANGTTNANIDYKAAGGSLAAGPGGALGGTGSPSAAGSNQAGMPGGGGAGMGGLGGGSNGFGGSQASGKGPGADASKKIDPTSVLSGYDGGGGGGGRSGGSYSRGDSGLGSSKYGAYLPGGANDPSRGIASQTFGNGQVTGAGSKSNWEKVNERYRDNKSTLMGN